MYGVVRGSRFWAYESCEQLWAWLLPVLRRALDTVTAETLKDWDYCFGGISNKVLAVNEIPRDF